MDIDAVSASEEKFVDAASPASRVARIGNFTRSLFPLIRTAGWQPVSAVYPQM